MKHKIIKAYPRSATCFATRDDAIEGLGIRIYITEDGYSVGLVSTKESHQGFPGIIHGGVITAYFDEVLWCLYELIDPGMTTVTLKTKVEFLKPVSVETDIRVVGHIVRIDERKFTAEGILILPDEQIAAVCSNIYYGLKKEALREFLAPEETDMPDISFDDSLFKLAYVK